MKHDDGDLHTLPSVHDGRIVGIHETQSNACSFACATRASSYVTALVSLFSTFLTAAVFHLYAATLAQRADGIDLPQDDFGQRIGRLAVFVDLVRRDLR